MFVGNKAGWGNIDGASNIYLGNKTAYHAENGDYNIAIGHYAGFSEQAKNAGDHNVFIGFEAGKAIDGTYRRTGGSVGNGKGSENVFIGYQAGKNNTTGGLNIYLGNQAGLYTKKGNSNIMIGYYTGSYLNDTYAKDSINDNIIIGNYAGSSTNGNGNVIIGEHAGFHNTSTYKEDTTGSNNVFIGNWAGAYEKGANSKLIISSDKNLGHLYPLIYGDFAQRYVVIGGKDNNNRTLYVNGDVETTKTLYSDKIWTSNKTEKITARFYNLYSGGENNEDVVAVYGTSSNGKGINIGIEGYAGSSESAATNRGVSGVAWSGGTAIGVYGKATNGTTNWAGYFEGAVKVTGTINGTTVGSSDSRLKKDVQTIDGALGKVLKLRGVSYYWKNKEEMGADSAYAHSDTQKHIGVIAQEIEQEFPELVHTDGNGYKSVEYSAIAPILIEAVKELKAEKDELQTKVDNQQQQIDELKRLVEELMKK